MVALPEPIQPTIAAIWKAYETVGNKPYISPRLGAAKAGAECDRDLWYSMRWVTKKIFTGRLLRLFQTGHIEEARMVADLRSAGVTVLDVDEDNIDAKTGKPKQWELTDDTGHIVCRMDGAAIGLIEAPKTWHVFETKTHGEKSYRALLKAAELCPLNPSLGLKASKPEHFDQCQLGMHFSGMERAYYIARNKNTDDLWSCRIEYDLEHCTRLVARLHRIIFAPRPPSRISENPSWFKCKFCDHNSTCHQGKLPARSCRTCIHITPVEGAGWHCSALEMLRDRDQQRDGCSLHLYIPDLVDGKQVGVGQTPEGLSTVEYLMPDGREWIDTGTDYA